MAVPPDAAGRLDCLLGPEVFDKAREDLGDLRLIDGKGREIPYALRVRPVAGKAGVKSRRPPFNQSPQRRRSSAGIEFRPGAPKPVEHRSLTVEPDVADNYRRAPRWRAATTAPTGGRCWKTAKEQPSLRVGDQAIDARTLTYPVSRFRYLRVIVYPDKAGDDKPNPPRVQIYKAVEKEGEDVTAPVTISPREPVPTPDGPGSVWYLTVRDRNGVDLTTFWERLSFEVSNPEFSRPYFVETADAGEPLRRLTAGQWVRSPGDPGPAATFSEVRARRLRLVVTDNRSAPLLLRTAVSTTAARELVFNLPDSWAPPLRLYFGNPDAPPGRYGDYAAALPAVLDPPPTRVAPGHGQVRAWELGAREPRLPRTAEAVHRAISVADLCGVEPGGADAAGDSAVSTCARRAVARARRPDAFVPGVRIADAAANLSAMNGCVPPHEVSYLTTPAC